MCIKNIYHNTYVDGEKDVTERVDSCRSGHICSDPIVREFDRKINCTRQQLGLTPGRTLIPRLNDSPSSSLKDREPIPYYFDHQMSPYGPTDRERRRQKHASQQQIYVDGDQVDPIPVPKVRRSSAMPVDDGYYSESRREHRSRPIIIENDDRSRWSSSQQPRSSAVPLGPYDVLLDGGHVIDSGDHPSSSLKDMRPTSYYFDHQPSPTYSQSDRERRRGKIAQFHDTIFRSNRSLSSDGIADHEHVEIRSPSETRKPQIVKDYPLSMQARDRGLILEWDRTNRKLEPNGDAAPSGSTVYTSDLYEATSVQSLDDSIFDPSESEMSSIPSLDNDTQAVFVGAFVDLLLSDSSVERMISRAASDARFAAESFLTSLSRILKMYSRDLRDTIHHQQPKEREHQRAAVFISRKKMRIASLLFTRYKERVPMSDISALDKVGQYLDGLESDSSDSSNDEGPNTSLTIAGLEAFLLQEKPFKALKWRLRRLIIPNRRVTQFKASAEQLLNFVFCNLGLEETFVRAYRLRPTFHAWLHSKLDTLAADLETELKEAGSHLVEYLRIYSVYLSAQAVRRLRQKPAASRTQDSESSCQEQDNMLRMELKPSQEILEDIMVEKLPEVFGEDLQQTAWARILSTKAFRGFFADLSDAAYPTFISECRKALKAEIDSQDRPPSDESEERHLLSILMEHEWCSALHGDRKFSLCIQSSDRVLLADRLKLAVEQSTGSEWCWWPLSPPPRAASKAHVPLEPLDLRQHIQFSATALPATRPTRSEERPEPSRISKEHTGYAKVKHYSPHRFSPIPSFSFPERGRDTEYNEYTYTPQPMTQAPITKHMFNDFFYSCYDSQSLKHSFFHKFLSPCYVIETLPQDLLESMPKRDREVMTGAQFSKVEHFWGIVAREQRSALRVVLYVLLSLMPTIWFTFMWLFPWGHEGDLQTATVPVTISIATLSMVWAVVYSGGETGDK
ncbi:hypothetical protein Daus18300_007885 [Diaporthe australafricana]|uniref:Uncharacterized protein n=1 Tax=Diaporthe australafricana TaxID=127596 RepID=A0ABR3WKW5_9PEZI